MDITVLVLRQICQILHLSNKVVQLIVCIDLCIAEKIWLLVLKFERIFNAREFMSVLTGYLDMLVAFLTI